MLNQPQSSLAVKITEKPKDTNCPGLVGVAGPCGLSFSTRGPGCHLPCPPQEITLLIFGSLLRVTRVYG